MSPLLIRCGIAIGCLYRGTVGRVLHPLRPAQHLGDEGFVGGGVHQEHGASTNSWDHGVTAWHRERGAETAGALDRERTLGAHDGCWPP